MLTRSVTICEHVRSPVSQPNLCPLSRVILGGQCWQPRHEQLQRQHREPPAEERGHGFQNTRSVQLRLYTGIESHCWLLSTSYCSKIHNIVLYKELSTRRVIDLNETWDIYETIPSLNCELYKIIISLLAPPFKGDVSAPSVFVASSNSSFFLITTTHRCCQKHLLLVLLMSENIGEGQTYFDNSASKQKPPWLPARCSLYHE